MSKTDRDRIIAIEHSYNVQIADLVALSTSIKIEKKIAKFTGRPITLNELVDALQKLLTSETTHVVLTYGA
uniref:Uncharacterized protein n=1 Tax=Ignisphaera aggregans TaxID=334771 RepID=A0A832ARH2_9CREN